MTDASTIATGFTNPGLEATERTDFRLTLFALGASAFAATVSVVAMGLFATGVVA